MRGLLFGLHTLPDLVILALIVGVATGLTMLAPVVGRHILRLPASKDRDGAAFDAFKAIMAMAGVVLAFSLVQANTNLHAAEGLVEKEATAISDLDRTLLRSNIPALVALRADVAAYGESLIRDEWPALRRGEQSEATDDAYAVISRAGRAFAPADARQTTIYGELTRQLDALADWRAEIAEAADAQLPSFFWITTGGLLALGVLLGALTDLSVARVTGLGSTSAAVALLLAFVVIVDRPFEGETSVSAKPIHKALVVAAKRKP